MFVVESNGSYEHSVLVKVLEELEFGEFNELMGKWIE